MTEASETHQKNPKRVAAGKNAAKKRKQNQQSTASGDASSAAPAFGNFQKLGQQDGEMWLKGFNSTIQSGLKQTLGAFRSSTSQASTSQAAGGAQGSSSSGGSQASTG